VKLISASDTVGGYHRTLSIRGRLATSLGARTMTSGPE
jgi:hypothetical protein